MESMDFGELDIVPFVNRNSLYDRVGEIEEDARKRSVSVKRVKRTKKKKKFSKGACRLGLITLAIVFIGSVLVVKKNYFGNSPANVVKEVQKILDSKEAQDSDVIRQYLGEEQVLLKEIADLEEEIATLEVEQQQNKEDTNNQISQIAFESQNDINAAASTIGDKILKSMDSKVSKALMNCKDRSIVRNKKGGILSNKEFYNFIKIDKDAVISEGLEAYSSFCDVDSLSQSLSDVEKQAVMVSLGYDKVEEYEGGPKNKEDFVRIVGGLLEGETTTEKLKNAKSIRDDVSLKMGKKLLEEQLGQSLDLEVENVDDLVGRAR